MQKNSFLHLFPDFHHRIQAGHRFLKNHSDTAAADGTETSLVESKQVGLSIKHC